MIIAGDFNVDLDCNNEVARLLVRCRPMNDHALSRGDLFVSGEKKATYVNTALGHESQIDYVLFSDVLELSASASEVIRHAGAI